MDNYPPFRVDEDAYYHISRRILDGTVYTGEGQEIGFTAGFPLVAAPFVAVFDKMGGYIANMLIVFISLVVFHRTLRRYGFRKRAAVLILIAAFASLEWFYAISNYSEPLAQLLVVLAFFARAGRSGRSDGIALLVSGFLTGLILFVRPHCVLVGLPFFLYIVFSGGKPFLNQRVFHYIGGAAGAMLLWLLRNHLAFGSPFEFEYTRLVGSFAPGMASSYMKGNIFLGIHGLLFDEYHGLFTITPIFLLFPAGLHAMWRQGLKRESFALLGAVALVTLFVASGPYPFTEFGLRLPSYGPGHPSYLVPHRFFLDGKGVHLIDHHSGGPYRSIRRARMVHRRKPRAGVLHGHFERRAVMGAILAGKGLLPRKTFQNEEALVRSYEHALKRANTKELLRDDGSDGHPEHKGP